MGALEDLLPDSIKRLASPSGNEWVLPRAEALKAVEIAKRHRLAVLGVEQFIVKEDGLLVLDYSGYDADIPYQGDWNNYASQLNEQAEAVDLEAHG